MSSPPFLCDWHLICPIQCSLISNSNHRPWSCWISVSKLAREWSTLPVNESYTGTLPPGIACEWVNMWCQELHIVMMGLYCSSMYTVRGRSRGGAGGGKYIFRMERYRRLAN
jgi:hypothetical protein